MELLLINMLRYVLLILSIASSCFMEEDFSESKTKRSSILSASSSPSSSSSSLAPSLFPWPLTVEAIEIRGPRDFKALSGDLVLWARLSPLVFNLTGALDQTDLAMQLFLYEDEAGGGSAPTLLATRPVSTPITTSWAQVNFPCNLIVQGGRYLVRLIRLGGGENEEGDFQVLSNITIQAFYPTIVFDVPRRIEAYTTAARVTVGLTRSTACEPKRPLPPTVLTLSICTPEEVSDPEDKDSPKIDKDCARDLATVIENPLHQLQKDGSITTTIECHLWARNSTFRLQLREKLRKTVIAKSQPIRVEWGHQFSINISKPTVMPCRRYIQALVTYPSCILPGRDRIRVYGHDTLSVPSLLVPSRLSYIGEHKVQQNARDVRFKCNLFPQRFLRFCFQYVNTAVDNSVAIVMEKCIPTNPPLKLKDGGWGPWSSWTPCTVTCGQDGRQYRYRFCDNPIPSSGANFCQGDSIQEKTCDALPDCPGSSEEEDDTDEDFEGEEDDMFPPHPHHPHPHSAHRHGLHQLQLQNLTITPDCECGCILYDLVPERNDTLVIFVSSNYSSPCSDEDEVDHHKFKWILHAKNERDRIRLDVVEMEVQCVTITFRDGNTTDSNLLQVITSSDSEHHPHPSHHYDELQQTSEDEDEHGDQGEWFEPLTLQSTGASLTISAFDSSTNKNCSGQFIYFIGYYSVFPSHNATLALTGSEDIGLDGGPQSYQFWVVKVILLFFVMVIILSGFGGCVTKMYRKEKYKELKCFDNEDERGGGEVGDANADDASRCTSVTLMSFDYSYWRQMRLLRLKYFLLRPRTISAKKVMSFPSTPTKGKGRRNKGDVNKQVRQHTTCTSRSEKDSATTGEKSCYGYRLSKSISLSETNLRAEQEEGQEKAGGVRVTEVPSRITTKKFRVNKGKKVRDPLRGRGGVGTPSPLPSSYSSDRTISLMSTPTPTPTDCSEENKEGRKIRVKRRKIPSNLTNKNGKEEKRDLTSLTALLKKRDIGKSQLSIGSSGTISTVRELEDADQDFEMDYYDYDVMNAGNIPGSYLGLEPAFVLWHSEVYQKEEGDEDEMEDDGDNEEPTEHDHLLIIPTSSSNVSSNNTAEDIEMTTTTRSSSLGIFTDSHASSSICSGTANTKRRITPSIRETSLDTLKFADDDEDEETNIEYDDNATEASDSAFDNERDLITDEHNNHHGHERFTSSYS